LPVQTAENALAEKIWDAFIKKKKIHEVYWTSSLFLPAGA
jgi:hypothetical protein